MQQYAKYYAGMVEIKPIMSYIQYNYLLYCNYTSTFDPVQTGSWAPFLLFMSEEADSAGLGRVEGTMTQCKVNNIMEI